MIHGLTDWWRRWRERRRAALLPESRWTVAVEGSVITVTDAGGTSGSLALDAIGSIVVETNDTGPWGTDCWWMLFRADRTLALAWPQGTTGEGDAVALLAAMPGFDHAAMVGAMTSTGNAVFVLWQTSPRK